MPYAAKKSLWNRSQRLYLELLEDRSLPSTSIPLDPVNWASLGPNHIIQCQTVGSGACSGRLTAVAAHPTDSETVYVASAGGGVWKTTTGGKSWSPLTDDQPTLFMGALALAPSNPDILYAGSGEANYGPSKVRLNRENIYYGLGILRSADAGKSWELVGQDVFHRRSISKIVVHPRNPNTLYVAVGARPVNGLAGNTGIWRSTDAGATWQRMIQGINLTDNDAVSDVIMDPVDSDLLYAAVGTPTGGPANGVYKSTNGGQSWAVAGNFPLGSADPRMGRISLALAPSVRRVVHAAIAGSGQAGVGLGLLRQVRSFDSGATWANLPNIPNYMSGSGDYMNVLAIDPRDANVVYAAGLDVIASRDGGITWFNVYQGVNGHGPHVDHHALTFDASGRLLDGNDGGIWRLENPLPREQLWSNLNTDLATLQFVGVALDPTNPDRAYGGLQDNGTVRFQDDYVWRHFRSGDGGYARVDPSNPQTYYVTYQYSTGSQFLARTDDGGGSFQSRTNGINTNDPGKFYQPYLLDPSNPSRLLLGTNRVYETTNRGNQWTAHSQPLANGWTVNNLIDSVAPAPSDINTIYASAGGRVFVTTNRGMEWMETNPVPPVPGLRLTDLKVDPINPAIAYVVSSSFNDLTGGGHVWFTVDYGVTWHNLSGDLPDLPVWTLAVDWGAAVFGDEVLYLGTDGGVYVSDDYGTSWLRAGLGLPNVQVHELELNLNLGILSAATHGRGLWQLEVFSRTGPQPGSAALAFGAEFVTVLELQPARFATVVQSPPSVLEEALAPRPTHLETAPSIQEENALPLEVNRDPAAWAPWLVDAVLEEWS